MILNGKILNGQLSKLCETSWNVEDLFCESPLKDFIQTCTAFFFFSKTGASYYAIQEMPLGVSKMILSSKPVFTILFARLFLGERLFCFDSIPILLMLTGFLLTVQPWNPSSRSLEAGYQDDFLDSAAILFAATILASNSTIILR